MHSSASSEESAAPAARQALAEMGNLDALEAELRRTCKSASQSLAYNPEWLVDDSCQCACGRGCPISKYRCIPCTVLSRGGNLKRNGPLRQGKCHYQMVRSPMGHPALSPEFAQEVRARLLLEKVNEVPEYYGSFYCSGHAIHLVKRVVHDEAPRGLAPKEVVIQLSLLLKKLDSLGFDLATVASHQLDFRPAKRCITVSGTKMTFAFTVSLLRVDGLRLVGERIAHWLADDYLQTLPASQRIRYHAQCLLVALAATPGLIDQGVDWADYWGSLLDTANGCLSHSLRLPVMIMADP